MKRDIHVCTDCRTKVLARPLATLPPKSTSRDWSTSKPTNSMSSTSNQGTGNQKGSNYFFGIIFSVAILILMCATCGIGSRTRYFARRRNLHRATKAHEWKEELMPPRLHEVGFVNAKGTLWKDVMVCPRCLFFPWPLLSPPLISCTAVICIASIYQIGQTYERYSRGIYRRSVGIEYHTATNTTTTTTRHHCLASQISKTNDAVSIGTGAANSDPDSNIDRNASRSTAWRWYRRSTHQPFCSYSFRISDWRRDSVVE